MSTASSMVRPEQVQALAQSVGNASKNINDRLTDLEQAVSKLRQSWSGEAQEAYDRAQRDWNGKIGELNTLLARISTATGEIGVGYVSNDTKSAGRFA